MKILFLAFLVSFVPAVGSLEDTLSVDIIPDFSTVGYKNGNEPLPDYPVSEVISVKDISRALRRGEYADTTAYIQAAIDRAGGHGGRTVLLRDGVYNLGRVLFIDKDNVVLRGESREKTILRSTGSLQRPAVVVGNLLKFRQKDDPEKFRNFDGRKFKFTRQSVADGTGAANFGKYKLEKYEPATALPKLGDKVRIVEDYCPVGRFWVEVESAESFAVGDDVIVERPFSLEWISDIGMDKIAPNRRAVGPVRQWTEAKKGLTMRWTKKVTAIRGNKVWLDSPLVQSLDKNYGGGYLRKYSVNRVSGCGIENLTVESSFDKSLKYSDGTFCDEKHTWYGVTFVAAEDCFARRVDVRYVGFTAVLLGANVRCATIEECSYLEPVNKPLSARRYGFCIEKAELCLFIRCYAERAAIGFASNSSAGGPNVFSECRGENMRTGSGPHQRWGTGTLYDCCYNSAGFRCSDHGNSGTGHGWCGANTVFWNVETEGKIQCESPWAKENTPQLEFHSPHTSGRNYSIGTVCGTREKLMNIFRDAFGKPVVDYYDSLGFHSRPNGKWYPEVEYDKSGTSHVSLPCPEAEAQFDWWPRFTIREFGNPLSLYQCQLEDRLSRMKK